MVSNSCVIIVAVVFNVESSIPSHGTLLIIINDARGEVDVLKNQNIVWLTANVDALFALGPMDKMNQISGTERSGIVRLHCNSVSPGAARHVWFSCPPGHTDTDYER